IGWENRPSCDGAHALALADGQMPPLRGMKHSNQLMDVYLTAAVQHAAPERSGRNLTMRRRSLTHAVSVCRRVGKRLQPFEILETQCRCRIAVDQAPPAQINEQSRQRPDVEAEQIRHEARREG